MADSNLNVGANINVEEKLLATLEKLNAENYSIDVIVNAKSKDLQKLIARLDEAADAQKALNEETKAYGNAKKNWSKALDFGKKIVNVYKQIGTQAANIVKTQLLTNIDAVNQSLEQLSGFKFSSIMSFSGRMSEISSYSKEILNNQISWDQELFTTYNSIAQAAKGSEEIYDTVVNTRGALTDNVKKWIALGGEAAGVQMLTGYISGTVKGLHDISEDLLFNWKEQNLNLGISDEHSAKIAANQNRAGMSLKASVKFQKDLFKELKKQFKGQALTSKMMEQIADSNWAILTYSKGNVKETARIAANAHAWNVSIDEIYSTAHKLSKAEEAIEMSRKAQLMFGLKLNARQMQYMAQTGKEADLVEYLVKTFRTQVGDFDQLTLVQRQYIADSIASGDIIKARTMLLGDAEKGELKVKSVQEQQLDLQRDSNKLLEAQTNNLAVYYKNLNEIKAAGWNEWKDSVTTIFGEEKSHLETSIALERIRMQTMNTMLLPTFQRLNDMIKQTTGLTSLLGDENESLFKRTLNAFKPLGDFISEIGFTIATWWVGNLGTVEKIFINFKGHGKEFGDIFTGIGDQFLGWLSNTNNVKALIYEIKKVFRIIAGIVSFIARNFSDIVSSILFAIRLMGALYGAMTAVSVVQALILTYRKQDLVLTKAGAKMDAVRAVFTAVWSAFKANWILGVAAAVGAGAMLWGLNELIPDVDGITGGSGGSGHISVPSVPNPLSPDNLSSATEDYNSFNSNLDNSGIESSLGNSDYTSNIESGFSDNSTDSSENRKELAELIADAIAERLLKSAREIEGAGNKQSQKFVPVLIGGNNAK